MNGFIDANLIKVKNNVEQTANTGKTTLRNMDANAPQNKHLVNKVYTANCCGKRPFLKDALMALYKRFGLPISDNLFKKEFIQIDNLEDLQKLITEVFIRFDTNPHFYNKADYFTLLRLISQSLLFLYLWQQDLIVTEWLEISSDEKVASEKLVRDTLNLLEQVAWTGSYNDLEDKPVIGAGKLNISVNGEKRAEFSANQTTDVDINLNVSQWGSIGGDIDSQTDLIEKIQSLIDDLNTSTSTTYSSNKIMEIINLIDQDLSQKIPVVPDAEENHIATFTDNGTVQDSGFYIGEIEEIG